MPFTKGTKRSAPRETRGDSEEDDILTSKPTKKTKTSNSAGDGSAGVDKDGNQYWDLSNKRRVGVSQFNKTTLVNIREFYEKDGEMLPGKKGISLSVAQYEALVKSIPAINAKLRELGHEVGNAEEGDGLPTVVDSSKAVTKENKSRPKKSNIEATSDEESN
ncbi:RNA polymerase II transcriptional coactivator [Colletotrichum truncatum]|uniref:RNA polymerase II transcriptional coactivator n=1 Tax=Colletotrichum truncatum TaxID=5467 RepID=A0ACC3ZET2_COLTU|nr:RNA polymerase II transcriptional coactivator [Colletotrichum truncatum]KAF6801520.1 RNA polymerase II transcriptional coactivator [Colletotrichum truncatum]